MLIVVTLNGWDFLFGGILVCFWLVMDGNFIEKEAGNFPLVL
jgi:hypothetical protein